MDSLSSVHGVVTARRPIQPRTETAQLLDQAGAAGFDAHGLIARRGAGLLFRASDRLTRTFSALAWREVGLSQALFATKCSQARAVRRSILAHLDEPQARVDDGAEDHLRPQGNRRTTKAVTRVLVIAPNYPSTTTHNAYAFVHARVQAYLEAGAEVFVAVPSGTSDDLCVAYDGVAVHRVSDTTLFHWVAHLEVDHVFVHSPSPRLLRFMTERCGRRPVTVFLHGHESRDRLRLSLNFSVLGLASESVVAELFQIERLSALKRFLETTSHRLVCPSLHHRDIVRADLQTTAPETRITVIPNPVSTVFFEASSRDIRERGRITILASGARPNYGAWMIPDLMQTLERLDPGLAARTSVIIYAADPGLFRVHPSLNAYGLPPQSADSMATRLASAECVINTSLYETQGMISCEAAVSGATVIACEAGGNAEHLRATNAQLVQPSGQALAHAAATALANPIQTDASGLDHMRPSHVAAADLEWNPEP